MQTGINDMKAGDKVEMKKAHPCGSKVWEILRLGADAKIKCEGCNRIVTVSRSKLEQIAKRVV